MRILTSTLWVATIAAVSTDAPMTAGRAIYKDNCAGCHTDSGTGAAQLVPRLARHPAVQSDDPTTLIRILLFGSQAAETSRAPTSPAMPSFA
jgi:mono/diheme cytochrome c family protein